MDILLVYINSEGNLTAKFTSLEEIYKTLGYGTSDYYAHIRDWYLNTDTLYIQFDKSMYIRLGS